ncbi:hypothetical protein Golax_012175, partial [Gossypium laxum]|nr:hypothetical protein [Gossypium laxum]
MFENETISEFYPRLCKISNKAFYLGKLFLIINWYVNVE